MSQRRADTVEAGETILALALSGGDGGYHPATVIGVTLSEKAVQIRLEETEAGTATYVTCSRAAEVTVVP